MELISAKQELVAEELFAQLQLHKKGMLLSAPVGAGKTRMTSMVLSKLGKGTILILAPQCVLEHWQRELGDMLGLRASVLLYHGPMAKRDRLLCDWRSTVSPLRVCLTTPETCYSSATKLSVVPFDYAVMDEIHRFRNPDGQMYRCIDAHFSHVKKMGLTGTLVTANAHRDMAALLQLVDKEAYTAIMATVAAQSRRTAKMVSDHLVAETRESLGIRVIPQREQYVYLSMGPEEITRYRDALQGLDAAYGHLMSVPEGHPAYRAALDAYHRALRALQVVDAYAFLYEAKEAMETVFPTTGKHQKVLDLLVGSGFSEPLLIFDDYCTGLKVLRQKLTEQGRYDVAMYTGEQTKDEKDAVLRAFRAGTINVLLMTKKAGGVGINLERAHHVIFLSTSFHPVDELQAIGRINRMTSTATKLKISYFCYAGGFSNLRQGVHVSKQAHADAILSPSALLTLPDPQGYYAMVCGHAFEQLQEMWTNLVRTGSTATMHQALITYLQSRKRQRGV